MHIVENYVDNDENCVDDSETTCNDEDDEEVTFDELQDKYNLMYTKWAVLVEINKMLKKDLQEFKNKKSLLNKENMS